jgi:FixJ family two-component response regulator
MRRGATDFLKKPYEMEVPAMERLKAGVIRETTASAAASLESF